MNEFHGGNGFFDVFIIFMAVVVKSNRFSIVFINSGGGDYRSPQISPHVFDNCFRIAEIRFGKNIKPIFVFRVTFGFDFFEGSTDVEFHFIEKSSAKRVAKVSIVEMPDMPPESIIAVSAFRDKTMDMRIPF